MATGNIPASMMKPMPSRMTANITSVKVKPRRKKRGFRVRGSGFREEHGDTSARGHGTHILGEIVLFAAFISFASDQGAVVAVDDQGDGVLVDPGFFGGLSAGVA